MCEIFNELNLNSWFDAMHGSIEGSLTVKNITCDLGTNKLPRIVVKEFLIELKSRWIKVESNGDLINKSQKEITNIAKKIFNEVIKSHDLDADSFYCRCRYGPVDVNNSSFSRVMSWREFVKYHLIEGILIPSDQSPSEEQVCNIMAYWDTKYKPDSTMRTRRPFAWITKSDVISDLENSLNGSDEKACETIGSTLRNRLGLVHYENGDGLVEIQYPIDELNGIDIKAPTFLDSNCGGNSAYCSTNQTDGYGRTINLVTYQADLPEVIHTEAKFSHKYKIRDLGKVKSENDFDQRKILDLNFPDNTKINLNELLDEIFKNLNDNEV